MIRDGEIVTKSKDLISSAPFEGKWDKLPVFDTRYLRFSFAEVSIPNTQRLKQCG